MDTIYYQLLNKLFNINQFRPEKTLENIANIAKKLSLPSQKIKYIHVAGTNGKGSCSLKISKVLTNSQYKVGLFTSPHLFEFQERIMINDKSISKNQIIEDLEFFLKFAEQQKTALTYFEYVTLLGLNFFRQQNTDLAVIEVGIGGKIDSTNIIQPILSVIPSIGYDHQEILGNTLEQIAEEKAGIIKPGIPCVIGPNAKPYSVFQKHAQQKQCELQIVSGNFQDYQQENTKISQSPIISLDLIFQVIVYLFRAAIEQLKLQGLAITDNYKQICEQSNPHCRMEIFDLQKLCLKNSKASKLLVLDVGHNLPAIIKIFETLKKKYPTHSWRILYGTSYLKDAGKCLKEISFVSDNIYLIQPRHQRAMKIQQLIAMKNELPEQIKVKIHETIEEGNIAENLKVNIENVFQDGKQNEGIVCIGSFLIMREIIDFFKLNINEIKEI